jgi:hypothetical protein
MRLHEIRRLLKPRSEVFAYTANLANAEEWDPRVVSARKVDSGRVGVGTTFDLVIRFGAVTIPIVYQITEYEPDYRLTLIGRNDNLETEDEIKFLDDGDNTVIDHTAYLTFRNYVRFARPLLAPFIRRAGARSIDALVATLEG